MAQDNDIIKELESLKTGIEQLPNRVEQLHDEFNSSVRLSDVDVKFMLVGIMLREFLILYFKDRKTNRLDDQKSAAKFHAKEKSNRTQKYFATKEEIISNPVPFDAIRRTTSVHEGFLLRKIKISGFDHRFTAIGHDPILGLIFGTANIMTNTITISTGCAGWYTYHVGTLLIDENLPEKGSMDKIYEQASTLEMFEKIISRIKSDKKEGFTALGTALVKEFIHLLSDVRTAKSLPIPIVSAVSPKFAQVIQLFGFDTLDLVDNTLEYYLAKLVDFGVLTLRDFYYRNYEVSVNENVFQARLQLMEKYMNEFVIVSEAAFAIKNVIACEYANAVRGYSYGNVLEAMQKVLSDGNKIAQLRNQFVLDQSVEYIKSL